MTDNFCLSCGGHHDPDTPDTTVVSFRGWVFSPPFRCICCGKEICARQFAFGRCCGPCDTGACDPNNRSYDVRRAHKRPEWWRHMDGQGTVDTFAEAVGARRENG